VGGDPRPVGVHGGGGEGELKECNVFFEGSEWNVRVGEEVECIVRGEVGECMKSEG
jgi:hypothetical protein